MQANELHQLTVHEAHELLKQRKISSVELTKSVLKRIGEVESKVRACVTVVEDMALQEAETVDNYIKTLLRLPL
jgi:aspartyl-tRNA(Asn)/glutamyl-tRNA(Gln) amidotransferase subunit A